MKNVSLILCEIPLIKIQNLFRPLLYMLTSLLFSGMHYNSLNKFTGCFWVEIQFLLLSLTFVEFIYRFQQVNSVERGCIDFYTVVVRACFSSHPFIHSFGRTITPHRMVYACVCVTNSFILLYFFWFLCGSRVSLS